MKLENKIAVITGGASGLGEATVRRFHANGAKCSILDLDDERANALVAELGSNVMYTNTDVTSEQSVEAAVAATVEAYGAIHINCNYAGIGHGAKAGGRKLVFAPAFKL